MLKSNVQIIEKNECNEHVGEHIGYELGVKMIKDYTDTFNEFGAQFVGKNILQEIINQPGCVGVNIFKALNEKGEKTYVLVGMDNSGNPILDITAVNPNGELNKKEGIVADRNKPVGWFY